MLTCFFLVFSVLQLTNLGEAAHLSGISIVKYKVPYEYLVTRTPIYTAPVNASFNLNNVIVKNCGTLMCFSAFYENQTMFQLISDTPNNCTTHPNCLSFNSTIFDYSIVFMNTTNNACTRNVTALLNEKFKMPECPSGWFSWTRPTGKLWCYMISVGPHSTSQTWNSTDSYCEKTYNASLNGFQTVEERASFIKTMQSLNLSIGWMYVGAVKSCGTSICDKSVQYVWQNGISTNNSIANDNFYEPYFNESGNCLAIMTKTGMYDDVSCTQQTTYSCGKWADIYP